MLPATYGLAAGGTTVLVAALIQAHAAGSRARVVATKPLASLTFLAASLAAGGVSTRYGQAILAAQGFAFVGDVLLLGRSKPAFVAGLSSFVLAHLTLSSGFWGRGVSTEATAVALAGLGGAGVFALRWLFAHVRGRMRIAIGVYVAVISAMVPLAVGLAAALRGEGRDLAGVSVAVGALAFYLSDLGVARERFVVHDLRNRSIGLPLYYGAQLLLAASIHLAG